jgi:hypothetical protein
MHLENDRRLIRRAALAALIGAAIGAGAGVYSLGGTADNPPAPAALSTETPPPAAPQPAPTIESPRSPAESTPIATNGVVARPRHDPAPPKHDRPTRPPAETPAGSAPAVVARARSLAERQDVLGLIALRETVVRAAQARGDADSAAVKSVLEQVDQRLNDARMMRLKSDAEQFRKAAARP